MVKENMIGSGAQMYVTNFWLRCCFECLVNQQIFKKLKNLLLNSIADFVIVHSLRNRCHGVKQRRCTLEPYLDF